MEGQGQNKEGLRRENGRDRVPLKRGCGVRKTITNWSVGSIVEIY